MPETGAGQGLAEGEARSHHSRVYKTPISYLAVLPRDLLPFASLCPIKTLLGSSLVLAIWSRSTTFLESGDT